MASINGRFGRGAGSMASLFATVHVNRLDNGSIEMRLPEAQSVGTMDADTAFALGNALVTASGRATGAAPATPVTTAPALPQMALPFDADKLSVAVDGDFEIIEGSDMPSVRVLYDGEEVGEIEPILTTVVTGLKFVR